jgi:non-ribosomal peptide synthetase component F
MVVGILAILKSGAAYVPIDGGVVTHATLEYILEDSGCCAVLSLPQFRSKIPEGARCSVLDLLELQSHTHDDECASVGEVEPLGDGAYVIYTSGQSFWLERMLLLTI